MVNAKGRFLEIQLLVEMRGFIKKRISFEILVPSNQILAAMTEDAVGLR